MTAREDFRAAVREAERSGCLFTEGQFRAIFRAGDAYVTAALLAFADRLDRIWAVACAATASERLRANIIEPTLKDAAEMARREAESHRTDAERAGSVAQDARSGLGRLRAADDRLEAGPE